VEAADFLLERGADVNSMPPRFYWDQDKGWSPLHKAIDTCNPDMMRYLLVKGADPDVKDRNWDESARNWANGGWTCLEVKEIIPE
jgi:ankyrin repeat protein